MKLDLNFVLWITVSVCVVDCAQGHNQNIEDRLSKLETAFVEQQRAHAAKLKTRDDVIKTLEQHVAQLTKSMFSTEGQLRSRRQTFNNEIEIAFFAKIGVNVDHLGKDQVVIFDEVVTDIDNTNSLGSYNNSSGIFTTPIDGLYVFSVTMHSLNHDSTHYAIYKNTDQITTIYLHGGDITTSDSTAQTVVLSLKRGDTISVHHRDIDHGAYGGGHSLFSGFLLRAHEEDIEVIG